MPLELFWQVPAGIYDVYGGEGPWQKEFTRELGFLLFSPQSSPPFRNECVWECCIWGKAQKDLALTGRQVDHPSLLLSSCNFHSDFLLKKECIEGWSCFRADFSTEDLRLAKFQALPTFQSPCLILGNQKISKCQYLKWDGSNYHFGSMSTFSIVLQSKVLYHFLFLGPFNSEIG